MTLAAVVLAAGRGERLRPLTDTTPKPLLRVGGETLLDAALQRVATVVPLDPASVAVNAHWLADQIVTHVGSRAFVSVEEPEALGTAGAIGQLRPWLGDRDVLIMNSDAWYDGVVDVPSFVAGWNRDQPRLLVVADDARPDFPGGWRFAGMSLLPHAMAQVLQPVPSGLYERIWSRTEVDLVPTEVTYIDCGTLTDLARARTIAASVRLLQEDEVARVAEVLGLARLDQGDGSYLVCWIGGAPAGHVHVTRHDPAEMQDLEVTPEHRRRGVASALIVAAEQLARGWQARLITLEVTVDNDAARQLYAKHGYVLSSPRPRRVQGTVIIRTGPIEVDDLVLTMQKTLARP